MAGLRAAASVRVAGQPGHQGPVATGQSCPALGALGHLDLQVLVLVQVAGSIPSLFRAKASTSDLPEEGGVLLLPAEPVGRGDRRVGGSLSRLLRTAQPFPSMSVLPGTSWGLSPPGPHVTASTQRLLR